MGDPYNMKNIASNMTKKEHIYNKLKKIRGENSKSTDIPFIETLNGIYSGHNVLEGFCSNTETLCNYENENLYYGFYKMCVLDNMIICLSSYLFFH